MGDPAGRKKMTILGLMIIVATVAVAFRALIEVPRITRQSVTAQAAAYYSLLADEYEKKGDLKSADLFRGYAADRLAVSRANRPDPIGYACYLFTLAAAALFLILGLVILVRRQIRKRI
jgi:hypothetical protein